MCYDLGYVLEITRLPHKTLKNNCYNLQPENIICTYVKNKIISKKNEIINSNRI